MPHSKHSSIHFWLVNKRQKVLALAVCVVTLSVSLFIPAAYIAQAASCTCFCGTPSDGAMNMNVTSDGSACATLCGKSDATFVGCYESESFYPRYSDVCWTEEECGGWSSISQPGTATFGGQSLYCEHQNGSGGAEMGYCYPPMKNFKLNVPILGVTEVGNLASYIDLLYRYAIPAGAIIAVIMVTIGGFQYMTAGGSKKGVTQGKERIEHALIGLVLLFGAYAIAYLIDPRLVVLSQIQLPLIKQAVSLSSSTSCEQLRDVYGYGVESVSPGATSCGDRGTITSIANVQANVVAGTFDTGDFCYYSGSCSATEACILNQTGDTITGQCLTCADVSTDSDAPYTSPNDYTCRSIAQQIDAKDNDSGNKYLCLYADDFLSYNACVQISNAPAVPYLNCEALTRAYSSTVTDMCSVYGQLGIDSFGLDASRLGTSTFTNQLREVCEQDPCRFAAASTPQRTNCVLDYGITESTCKGQ